MDNNVNNNVKENADELLNENEASQIISEIEENNDSGNKLFRGLLTAAVLVSSVVFICLLIYFCKNTGA